MAEAGSNHEDLIAGEVKIDTAQLERLSRRFAKARSIKVDTSHLERVSRRFEKARAIKGDLRRLEHVSRRFAKPPTFDPAARGFDLAEVLEPFQKQLAAMADPTDTFGQDLDARRRRDAEMVRQRVLQMRADTEREARMLAAVEDAAEYARREAEYAARAEARAQLAETRADRAEARDRRMVRVTVVSLVIGAVGAAPTAYKIIGAIF
jgi:hypothetical protein